MNLKNKAEWIDNWQLRNKKDCDPSHAIQVVKLSDVLEAVQKLKENGGCNFCEDKTKPQCFIDHPDACVILWSYIDEVFGK